MIRGQLITIEGGDGVGKTTLHLSVAAYLKQLGVALTETRAPGGTKLGQQIRSLVLTKREEKISNRCELLLYLADRAQLVDEVILPALSQNHIVLCDRFNDSTVAYQGGARGFTQELVTEFCAFACKGLSPNLTLYLDLDPALALQRLVQGRGKDRIEDEELTFHHKVRSAFHEIACKEPNRFKILDASRSPNEVFEQAKEKIDALLQLNRK